MHPPPYEMVGKVRLSLGWIRAPIAGDVETYE